MARDQFSPSCMCTLFDGAWSHKMWEGAAYKGVPRLGRPACVKHSAEAGRCCSGYAGSSSGRAEGHVCFRQVQQVTEQGLSGSRSCSRPSSTTGSVDLAGGAAMIARDDTVTIDFEKSAVTHRGKAYTFPALAQGSARLPRRRQAHPGSEGGGADNGSA